MVCQLGLDRIVLSKAWMLPRDYLLLVEELTISSDVSLPDVVVMGKLGAEGLVGWTKAATTSGGDEGDPKNGRRRARGWRDGAMGDRIRRRWQQQWRRTTTTTRSMAMARQATMMATVRREMMVTTTTMATKTVRWEAAWRDSMTTTMATGDDVDDDNDDDGGNDGNGDDDGDGAMGSGTTGYNDDEDDNGDGQRR